LLAVAVVEPGLFERDDGQIERAGTADVFDIRNPPSARIVWPAAGEDDAVATKFEHAFRTRTPDGVLHPDAPVRLHGVVGEFGDEALIEAILPQLVDRGGDVAAKLVCAAGGDADRVVAEFQLVDIRVGPSPGVIFHALE
jgi:hypothetical protein